MLFQLTFRELRGLAGGVGLAVRVSLRYRGLLWLVGGLLAWEQVFVTR